MYLCIGLKYTIMKQTLAQLKNIEKQALNLNQKINDEGKVYAAELADRKRLGLTGDAAIKHYNDWMKANGMEHLVVK